MIGSGVACPVRRTVRRSAARRGPAVRRWRSRRRTPRGGRASRLWRRGRCDGRRGPGRSGRACWTTRRRAARAGRGRRGPRGGRRAARCRAGRRRGPRGRRRGPARRWSGRGEDAGLLEEVPGLEGVAEGEGDEAVDMGDAGEQGVVAVEDGTGPDPVEQGEGGVRVGARGEPCGEPGRGGRRGVVVGAACQELEEIAQPGRGVARDPPEPQAGRCLQGGDGDLGPGVGERVPQDGVEVVLLVGHQA